MSEGAGQPIEAKLVPAAPPRLRYLYIYSFVFESPNWKLNLLYGFLCFLSGQVVPVLGPLVYLGYACDVMESVIRFPERIYPDFDPAKFSYYLQRSLAPFLVSLVFLTPAMLFAGAIWGLEFAAVVAAAATSGKNAAPIIVAGGMVSGFVIFVCALTLFFVPATGFLIRAALSQDVAQGFNVRWSLDFLKRVWLELLLINLFNVVTIVPMMFLGAGCCLIGMFLVQALDAFASISAYCQLYNLYLARGGEPVPFKDPPAPAVPYVAT